MISFALQESMLSGYLDISETTSFIRYIQNLNLGSSQGHATSNTPKENDASQANNYYCCATIARNGISGLRFCTRNKPKADAIEKSRQRGEEGHISNEVRSQTLTFAV